MFSLEWKNTETDGKYRRNRRLMQPMAATCCSIMLLALLLDDDGGGGNGGWGFLLAFWWNRVREWKVGKICLFIMILAGRKKVSIFITHLKNQSDVCLVCDQN